MHQRTVDRRPGTDGPRERVLRRLAVLAITGNAILVASAWLLPSVSEFTLMGDSISELALGRLGFVVTGAFLLAGAGTAGLAFAIRALTRPSRKAVFGCLLVAVYGVGAVLSAIFPTDRVDGPVDFGTLSTAGTIHVLVAVVSFVSVVVGMVILTFTFRREASWRSLTVWSALLTTAAMSLLLGQSEGPTAGLMQRLLVTVVAGWLVLVASRVRAIAPIAHA